MDAHSRSAGASSCSASHFPKDTRAFRIPYRGFTFPCTLRSVRCISFKCSVSRVEDAPVLLKRERDFDTVERHILVHNRAASGHCRGVSNSPLLRTSIVAAAGVAALSVLTLLVPGDAQAAELLPLDLFSSFLVSAQMIFKVARSLYSGTIAACLGVASY
jgi:hypothetical protein